MRVEDDDLGFFGQLRKDFEGDLIHLALAVDDGVQVVVFVDLADQVGQVELRIRRKSEPVWDANFKIAQKLQFRGNRVNSELCSSSCR